MRVFKEYDPRDFPLKVKRQLHKEHGGCCAYCGEKTNEYRRVTIHHKTPRSMGGLGSKENGVPLCKPGCHDFFDALAQENGVTYDEYVAETEKLRRKDRRAS